MRKLYHRHREKINYLLVGGWNTVFGFCVFAALYYLFGQKIHYLFLLVISNVISITNAYVGYKIFVFKTRGNYLKEYLRFYVVYGFTFGINFVFLPLIVEFFQVNPVMAQAFFIGINVVISYTGHKRFSFKTN
ncbi:MAG: GtrA family protein [bacterium]